MEDKAGFVKLQAPAGGSSPKRPMRQSMSNVTDLTERRKRDAIDGLVAHQGDQVAKALMSMSRMSWANGMTGDEALRRAAQAFQAAAGKMK